MFIEWIVIGAVVFAFGSGIRILPQIAWGLPRWKSLYTVGIDVFLYLRKIQEDRARRLGNNALFMDGLIGTDYLGSLAKAGWGGKLALYIIELTGSDEISDELKMARVFYFYMFFVSIAGLVIAYLTGVRSIIQEYLY